MMADERGRIPFAVLAVLLLVSSAAVAATMGPSPTPAAPAVDVVHDRVEAEQRTALRRAVRTAANDAASDPVIDRAETPVGRALSEKHTFRDSLRLRAYAAARDQLSAIERRREGVIATTRLPPIDGDSRTNVSAAIDRVGLSSAGENRTALTVTFRNVTTTVRKNGRVVDRRERSVRVTVATPVLTLHDRVAAYQERLDAGVAKPGLTQRLTAIMNAVGWARGYAQYHGAPIGNVISNGHVRVATNAALLDVQRSTLGKVDSRAVGALGEDVAKVSAQEAVSMAPGSSPFLSRAISNHDVTRPNEVEGVDVPARDTTTTVGVNRTATDSFTALLNGVDPYPGLGMMDGASLDGTIEKTYTADVRVATAITARSGPGEPAPDRPGPGWERAWSRTETDVTVSAAGPAGPVGTDGHWHAFETWTREVRTEYTVRAAWVRDGERTETTATGHRRKTVTISLVGRHAPRAPGPERRIAGVHENGSGPLDGPNLNGVADDARDELLPAGGVDDIAEAAAAGTFEPDREQVHGRTPDGLENWIYRDLMTLREEVAAIEVTVEQRAVGTFEVNPPRMLKEKIESHRAELIDAPETYDGVADRARVAARAQYLNVVTANLEWRAEQRESRRGRLSDQLGDDVSVDDLQQSADASVQETARPQAALDGPGGPVSLQVDAAPAYLDFGEITEQEYPTVDGSMRPLYAKNVNQFQMPFGEAAGAVVKLLTGPKRTSLASAAQTLERIERNDIDPAIEGIDVDVGPKVAVETRLRNLRGTAAERLGAFDVGDGRDERVAIIKEGLSRWETTSAEAQAVANGSATPAIVAAADDHADLSAVQRDKLTLSLNASLRTDLRQKSGRPKAKLFRETSDALEAELKGQLKDAAKKAADRAAGAVTNGTLARLPSGLPVAPLPGYWYATTNVWTIDVEGEYARFGLRASRGRPTDPGSGTMYARDGEPVTLDVDDDGQAERLGRSTRVSFASTVHVVVVVPPGPQGVGDTGGDRTETSPGWPPPE